MKTSFKIVSVESSFPTRVRIKNQEGGDQLLDFGDMEKQLKLLRTEKNNAIQFAHNLEKSIEVGYATQKSLNELANKKSQELKQQMARASQVRGFYYISENKQKNIPEEYLKNAKQILQNMTIALNGLHLPPVKLPSIHSLINNVKTYNFEQLKEFETNAQNTISLFRKRANELGQVINKLLGL